MISQDDCVYYIGNVVLVNSYLWDIGKKTHGAYTIKLDNELKGGIGMDTFISSEGYVVLSKLNERQKNYVTSQLATRSKESAIAYLCWVILGAHYFYFGKPLKNIILWLTCFILIGVIWWFIDLFRIPGMVKEYNRELFFLIVDEAIQMYPDQPYTSAQSGDQQMVCPQCGADIEIDSQFCPKCGTKLV